MRLARARARHLMPHSLAVKHSHLCLVCISVSSSSSSLSNYQNLTETPRFRVRALGCAHFSNMYFAFNLLTHAVIYHVYLACLVSRASSSPSAVDWHITFKLVIYCRNIDIWKSPLPMIIIICCCRPFRRGWSDRNGKTAQKGVKEEEDEQGEDVSERRLHGDVLISIEWRKK